MRAPTPRGLSAGVSRGVDALAAATLIVVVVGSALAVGGVHPKWLSLLLLMATLGAAPTIAFNGLGRARPLFLLMLGVAAYTAFQAVPLPAAVVRLLAPANADAWQDGLRAWREAGPSRHPISLDPDATWIEVARHTTYAATLVLATRCGDVFGRRKVVALLFGTAILVALITVVHGVLGLRELYGIYTPRYATPLWLSPLLNQNNLAGYLNLGFFCGAALLLSRRTLGLQPLLALGMAILAGVSVLTGSRGGLLALLVGVVAVGVLQARRLLKLVQAGLWKPLLAATIVALAIVAFSAPERTWSGYHERHTKLALFGWVLQLIRATPWVGVGRGAFEVAFPMYRGASLAGGNNNVVFAHAESFPLQWAAEWGIPVALVVIVGIVLCLRPWERRFAPGAWLALAGGLGVVTAQNLVDVALEVPGVCIAMVCAASILVSDRRPHAPRPSQPVRWSLLAGLTAGALGAVWLAFFGWRAVTVTQARDDLRQALSMTRFSSVAAAKSFDSQLRFAVSRRPSEPYLNILGALAAEQSGGNSAAWLSRALELDPSRSDTYFILGRVLARRGHLGQGFVAMRRAVEIEPELARKVARAAVKLTRDPEQLSALVPEGPAGFQVVLEVAKRLRGASRTRFLESALARGAGSAELRNAAIDAVLTELEAKQSSCSAAARPTCVARVEDMLRKVSEVDARGPQLVLMRGRLLAITSGERAAFDFMKEKCGTEVESIDCAKFFLLVAARVLPPDEFQSRVREFLNLGCKQLDGCVDAEQHVGELYAQRKDLIQSMLHLQRAAQHASTPTAWRRVAEVARAAGAEGRAVDALRRAEHYERYERPAASASE